MSYTWQDIQNDWLGGAGPLAAPPEVVVNAFNQVESTFGRIWLEGLRAAGGQPAQGLSPVIDVIMLAQMLEALDNSANASILLRKIGENDQDAWAELCSIYILRSGRSTVEIEVEPQIKVRSRNPRPDFRARIENDPWAYVEVTQPSRNSIEQTRIRQGMDRFIHMAAELQGSFSVEIFLRRDPDDKDLDIIEQMIASESESHGETDTELPSGLGTLYWNRSSPGTAVIDNHGEPYRPGLAVMATAQSGGQNRHILLRWPFTDVRAEAILRRKSKQLTTDFPGLVMIQTSGAVGAMKAWRGLIQKRFQPGIHTRISAVCIFRSGKYASDAGYTWGVECKLIPNPHARNPLPSWIVSQFEKFPSQEADMFFKNQASGGGARAPG